ncbi:restriction endonuclease subunit S [Alginatibacterium sediminis]|uniref:Restriction endonuclease subunit S n=1 Tax=Alginatibacterium sediminis TaxID=2164068 RepID=A0A420EHF8_9ALTE|nr:restriction endonuclease subunit S [Alginatibacterium sediminis]RKF20171.1 restriction endonuclease subunit S [Alginatibacterium sediminis]
MKIKTIFSHWIKDESYRLDCPPYVAGAIESKQRIKDLKVKKIPLGKLVIENKGLYKGKMIKRTFVDSIKDGVPFLTTSGMLRFDLRPIPNLVKSTAQTDKECFISEGTTLISAAGTIGNMTFVRKDMENIFACGDILKVIPNSEKIAPGYLYTYLSSKYGLPQVTQGTYGSIVQHLDPKQIIDLSIPIFDKEDENAISRYMHKASDSRAKAQQLLLESRRKLSGIIGFDVISASDSQSLTTVASSKSLINRLDSHYYSDRYLKLRKCITSNTNEFCKLEDVAEVFIPNIFKRQYAIEKQFGIPYITGADVFKISPSSERYLMTSVVEKNRLQLEKGMILIQEAGQLGGLIGRSVFVGENLSNFSCSNNMIRVKGNEPLDSYYLFALLSLPEFEVLIAAEAAGSSIPHIEEKRVKNLNVYWPNKAIRDDIASKVKEAIDLIDKGHENEDMAYKYLDKLVMEY